jgi:hypothetical protein
MKKILLCGILIVVILSLSGIALAADGFDLSWWTVDGGGGTSSGGGYALNGTLGQPDAGTVASGGGYTLAGGFWHGGAVVLPDLKLYLPLLTK